MEKKEESLFRVKQMEAYYDLLQDITKNCDISNNQNSDTKKIVEILKEYQESGQWLMDYECDERGEFPQDLKRGVLSEDGLYNLLDKIKGVVEHV